MEKHEIMIAVIQETKFTKSSKMKKSPGYHLVREDRRTNTRGGGVAFFVHESVPFQKVAAPPSLDNDKHLESLTIQISCQEDTLQIRNIYIPPASSCDSGYSPPINSLRDGLTANCLILGDFNAHSQLWSTEDSEDDRGRDLADWIGNTNIGVLNEDQPTRVTANASTAPDVSLASSSLLPTCSQPAPGRSTAPSASTTCQFSCLSQPI